MYQLELHFHTKESSRCGKVPAVEGIRMYLERGYDGVVVTDHFSKAACLDPEIDGDGPEMWYRVCQKFLRGYWEAKRAADRTPLRVYLGMEIRFPNDENDFLVYGIDEGFLKKHPWIYMKELPDLYKIAQKEGLAVVQAHPFRKNCFLGDIGCLHGIEIYNGNPRHDSRNELAEQLALEKQLTGTVGSDFHQPQDLAACSVEMESLPKNEQELARRIREKQFYVKI